MNANVGKGKVFPLQSRCGPEGGYRYSSALPWQRHWLGGEWSAARPSRTLPPGKTRYPFYRRFFWAPGLVWTGGKSRRHRDSIPDRLARSQSLYRLSYPACECRYHQNSSLWLVKVTNAACTHLWSNLWRWYLACKYFPVVASIYWCSLSLVAPYGDLSYKLQSCWKYN